MTEEHEQDQPKSQVEAQREADDSQQAPQHDSGLQTPQPDQRMPTEAERSASEPTQPGQTADTPSDQTVDTEDGPKDAPAGYEPQVPLQPGQTGEMVERHGEQPSDVDEVANDQLESSADENDDLAVDDPAEVSQEPDNPGESG